MLHPDLVQLLSSYTAVLDDHEAGHLPYDDAVASIAAMTAIDGAGFVWSIDTNSGEFMRARPGEHPEFAQPSAFVPAQLPNRGGQTWGAEDLMRPPAQSSPVADPLDGPVRLSSGRSAQPGPGKEKQARSKQSSSLAKSEASGLGKLVSPDSKIGALLAEKKRTVIVAVGCLAVVVAVVLLKPQSDATEVPGPPDASSVPAEQTTVPVDPAATTPVDPAATAPVDPAATVPVDPAATTPVDPAAPAPLPAPSVDEQVAVIEALASGDRARVAAAVLARGGDRDVVLRTAQYAGYRSTGLLLSVPAPGEVDAAGSVVSRVDLVDQATGSVVSSGVATWVLRDTGWVLAAYVDFT